MKDIQSHKVLCEINLLMLVFESIIIISIRFKDIQLNVFYTQNNVLIMIKCQSKIDRYIKKNQQLLANFERILKNLIF